MPHVYDSIGESWHTWYHWVIPGLAEKGESGFRYYHNYRVKCWCSRYIVITEKVWFMECSSVLPIEFNSVLFWSINVCFVAVLTSLSVFVNIPVTGYLLCLSNSWWVTVSPFSLGHYFLATQCDIIWGSDYSWCFV